MKKIRLNLILILLLGWVCTISFAQTQEAENAAPVVKGVVVTPFKGKLAGIRVISINGGNEAWSNHEGVFRLPITDGSTSIRVNARGFKDAVVEALPENEEPVEIVLERDVNLRDEELDLGYTTMRRQAVSGAVSTVTGAELERSPVANLTMTLPGRLPGLITYESFSELSRASTSLFSRGINSIQGNGPLAIIDGILISYNVGQTLEYINPTEIESISYLKDAATQALFGIQGAHGVLVVKTKRGLKGGLQISGRVDKSFQQGLNRPHSYSSYEYALMKNQAGINDGHGANFWFNEAELEGFRSGSNPQMYPNQNWADRFLRKWSAMERASLNFTGGNENVQFFSNINFMHQGGNFKTEQEKYDPNNNNIWVNFRTNVDMKLARFLKGYIRLAGNIKRERTPGASVSQVYESIWQLPPTMNGPLTPEVLNPDTGLPTLQSNQVVTTDRIVSPTFGLLNRSGYFRHTVTNINSQFGLTADLGSMVKGLSLGGQFVFQTNSVGHLATTQNFERYVRTSNRDELIFQKKGSDQNTPLAYGKSASYYYHLSYKLNLDYVRTFGKHSVNATGYYFYQDLTNTATSAPDMFPYRRLSLGGQATYGYADKYFVTAALARSGSEQYSKQSRYTTTPSIGASWVVSNEAFLKESGWLSYLKLRASYGITATDRSGLGRYTYLDNITVSNGGRIGYLQYTINEIATGNPFLTAEKVKKQNFGIDLGLFNTFYASVDLFKEKMDNMIVSAVATVPKFQGIPLGNYPQTNSGIYDNRGYEISAGISKTLNKNLDFTVGGYIAGTTNKITLVNESRRTDDYVYPYRVQGFTHGQQFGYLVDYSNGNGFFNTEAELQANTVEYTFGTPRLGDLKYQDLNGDGKLDERDQAPLGTGNIPRTTYGINGSFRYKAFDLHVLFQGMAGFKSVIGGTGVWETSGEGIFGELHQYAWTPERFASGEKILYPALSTVQTVNHQGSDFFLQDRSYLRLKNVELGYTLPNSVSRVIRADRARLLVSAQNLFTWDKMKSDDFGPEGGGFVGIPVYRVYNVGLTVTF